MKIVVIGGSGLIGSKLVSLLVAHGHDPLPASPATGVNSVTGEGLADALAGAEVVVDVSNAPDWEDNAVMEFFHKSTSNLLAAELTAGVRHHVALSIVGVDRLTDVGYFRAKVNQERLLDEGSIPVTILRATQFMEFVGSIVEGGADGDVVRLSPALLQPVAADDVAATLAELATEAPRSEHVEVAGPEAMGVDAWARHLFAATGDDRQVVVDPEATYFGAKLSERSLIPDEGRARLGAVTFDAWLATHHQATR